MISVVNQIEWSDVVLGVLQTSIPSGFEEETIKIAFDENIRPFPEPPFVFVIGGQLRSLRNLLLWFQAFPCFPHG